MSEAVTGLAAPTRHPIFSGVIAEEFATVLVDDGEVQVTGNRFEVHQEHLLFFQDGDITSMFERHREDFKGFVVGHLNDLSEAEEEDCPECDAEAEGMAGDVDPLEWLSGLFYVDEPIPYTLNGDWRNPEAYR